MWKEYTVGKRTYKELSEQTKLSIPIIQSRLDKFKIKPKSIKPREVMLVMDKHVIQRMLWVDGFQGSTRKGSYGNL